MMEALRDYAQIVVGLGTIAALFASVPLAFIYGDKVDVLISLVLPFYGIVVWLGS